MSNPQERALLERFMRDAEAGVKIWYYVDNTILSGCKVMEPDEERPWTFHANQAECDRLLVHAPGARRIWYVRDLFVVEVPQDSAA